MKLNISKKDIKANRGITLIALVITIVLKRYRVGRYEECRI